MYLAPTIYIELRPEFPKIYLSLPKTQYAVSHD